MDLISSCMVGVLFAAGVYLALRHSLVDLVLGLSLFSTATILLLIAVGGWTPENRAPLLEDVTDMRTLESVEPGQTVTAETTERTEYADPLPQALILTALVIGFGMLTYLIALVSRAPADEDLETPVESPPAGEGPR